MEITIRVHHTKIIINGGITKRRHNAMNRDETVQGNATYMRSYCKLYLYERHDDKKAMNLRSEFFSIIEAGLLCMHQILH